VALLHDGFAYAWTVMKTSAEDLQRMASELNTIVGSFKVDEFAKSRQETMFVTYHEGHEEHEAEIIKYFLTLRVLRALRGENQTFYGFIKV
jgi:hypothetical protein